jgi:Zn-dependent protease with chaperone function
MALAVLRRRVRSSPIGGGTASRIDRRQPAAIAAARISRASLLLGGLGLFSAIFVLARLFESWRITPHAASHRISILGQQLSYPAANVGAIVVVVLAALGLMVTAVAVRATVLELAAARRFHRWLAQQKLRHLRGALVIDDGRPQAFCAGLIRPRVYISTGALALLDDSGLDAVMAHERHHASRRDPLRLAAGRVFGRALFLLPGLGALIERQQALAELSADEGAVNAAPANRSGLAAAMLSFSEAAVAGRSPGIDPARVDFLLGESPSWRFPLALCLGGSTVIALLLAIAVLAGQVAYGSATLAPPFLSRQPCVVVLAVIPAALGLLAVVHGRKDRTRSAPRTSWSPPLGD